VVAYQLVINKKTLKYLEQLPEIVRNKCKALAEDPFPGKHGDKEQIHRKAMKTSFDDLDGAESRI